MKVRLILTHPNSSSFEDLENLHFMKVRLAHTHPNSSSLEDLENLQYFIKVRLAHQFGTSAFTTRYTRIGNRSSVVKAGESTANKNTKLRISCGFPRGDANLLFEQIFRKLHVNEEFLSKVCLYFAPPSPDPIPDPSMRMFTIRVLSAMRGHIFSYIVSPQDWQELSGLFTLTHR